MRHRNVKIEMRDAILLNNEVDRAMDELKTANDWHHPMSALESYAWCTLYLIIGIVPIVYEFLPME